MKIKLKLGEKDKKEKAHFSIIWTARNGSLKYKDYPLTKYNEVFEKWYSLRFYNAQPQIVIDNPSSYTPTFDITNTRDAVTKEVKYERFLDWLVEELEWIGVKMEIPEATEEAFWKRSQEYWSKKA